MNKHIKINFVGQFSKQARSGHQDRKRLESIAEPIPLFPEDIKFCKYIEKCNKACFEKDEYCGVKKFYDRYGINNKKMFI